MIVCPECDTTQTPAATLRRAEVIECTDCRTELEVVSTEPLVVAAAPEVEEDWGE